MVNREVLRYRLSPFGIGEVCFRDFEAVHHECLLVKPSMAHIETRPNIYIPGETYVPVRWDFSDLADICRYYLDHEAQRSRIAGRAARVLGEFHAEHQFIEILGQLLDRLGLRPVRSRILDFQRTEISRQVAPEHVLHDAWPRRQATAQFPDR